jgi:hypothetical protein
MPDTLFPGIVRWQDVRGTTHNLIWQKFPQKSPLLKSLPRLPQRPPQPLLLK